MTDILAIISESPFRGLCVLFGINLLYVESEGFLQNGDFFSLPYRSPPGDCQPPGLVLVISSFLAQGIFLLALWRFLGMLRFLIKYVALITHRYRSEGVLAISHPPSLLDSSNFQDYAYSFLWTSVAMRSDRVLSYEGAPYC